MPRGGWVTMTSTEKTFLMFLKWIRCLRKVSWAEQRTQQWKSLNFQFLLTFTTLDCCWRRPYYTLYTQKKLLSWYPSRGFMRWIKYFFILRLSLFLARTFCCSFTVAVSSCSPCRSPEELFHEIDKLVEGARRRGGRKCFVSRKREKLQMTRLSLSRRCRWWCWSMETNRSSSIGEILGRIWMKETLMKIWKLFKMLIVNLL